MSSTGTEGFAARRDAASINPAPKLASKAARLSTACIAPVAIPQYPEGALWTALWKRVGAGRPPEPWRLPAAAGRGGKPGDHAARPAPRAGRGFEPHRERKAHALA